ncbi:MAG: CBS domain-containing protein [Promethearchaeota archaeon]
MDLNSITAEDIMSAEVTVTTPMEKLSSAEILMIKKNIGGLPVVSPETKKLIGILTQRDVQLSRTIIGTEIFHVDDIYSKNPINAKIDDSLSKIIQKMNDNNVERIPIVDDHELVIGIVVTKDIIRALGKFFQN